MTGEKEWWMSDHAQPPLSRSDIFFEALARRLQEDPTDPVALADRLLNEIQMLRQRASRLEGREEVV